MFGRRSHQRFSFSTPAEGTFRVVRDVLVEHIDGDRFTALSRRAGIVGETLMLELSETGGAPVSVRTIESRPAVGDGAVRHRLVLEGGARGVATLPPALEAAAPQAVPAGASLAALTRNIPVRVLNCSSSGCLLESGAPIDVGTAGLLRLRMDNQECEDDVHIVRCRLLEGSSVYHLGGEFLWTAAPGRQSVRLAIRHRPEEMMLASKESQISVD